MINKVILVGRLGKDPEVRNVNNTSVASFSIATSESYKDKTTGEKKETTEWHNIVMWRGLAEVAQKYLHKGDLVYIEGKIKTRSWEKDGVTRYVTEILADNLTMLSNRGSNNSSNSSNSSQPAQQSKPQGNDSSIDDMPF